MNYISYPALGWNILRSFETETLDHTGSINGGNSHVGFISTKHIGVVLLVVVLQWI